MNQNKTFTSDRTLFYGPTETVDETPIRTGKNVSDVTAMVVDCGLFVEMARTLGRSYKKVYYCVPSWVTAFPRMNVGMIGTGFEEIEVCYSIFDRFEAVDLYVFPDVGFSRLQEYLLSQGKAVWGCGLAEKWEFDRVLCKEKMKELRLPVGPYEIVKGTEALKKYLKDHKDQYVKISKWRGSFESFHSPNYKTVEPKLDEIDMQLGAFKYTTEFVCEDALNNKFEVAVDTYNIDGKIPKTVLIGCEIKDHGYLGQVCKYDDIPEPLKLFDKAFSAILKEDKCRSFYSPETRIGKDRIPYQIDLCIRAPSPGNEIYQCLYSNFAETIWEGGNGNCIDPKTNKKWAAEIIIHSSWACKNWQPIDFPKEMSEYVKLRNSVKINGKLYTMPHVGTDVPEIGACVGYGNTMEDALKMAKIVGDSVEGYYVEIPDGSLNKAIEEIVKAKSFGAWVN